MKPRIVVAGSSNTDMVLHLDHLPRAGETVLGGRFESVAGGKGANQAVAAARSGAEVALIARLGDDAFGRQACEGFQAVGLDCRHVVTDAQQPSGVALIFVDRDGENCIGVAAGANGQLSPADIDAGRSAIAAADALMLQLETPLPTVAHAVGVAGASGIPVILNPAPARELDPSLLAQVSWLTPNASEAAGLTGAAVDGPSSAARAATRLRSVGVENVVVTLGRQGAWVDTPTFTGHVPAYRVATVDATAAGDVFNGALAVALAEHRSTQEAVQFAIAAAALSVTRSGAQPSAPQRDEIEQFLMNPPAPAG